MPGIPTLKLFVCCTRFSCALTGTQAKRVAGVLGECKKKGEATSSVNLTNSLLQYPMDQKLGSLATLHQLFSH